MPAMSQEWPIPLPSPKSTVTLWRTWPDLGKVSPLSFSAVLPGAAGCYIFFWRRICGNGHALGLLRNKSYPTGRHFTRRARDFAGMFHDIGKFISLGGHYAGDGAGMAHSAPLPEINRDTLAHMAGTR